MSETVKLGKVSMTLGGEYKSSQSYDKLTCVYYEGSSWASKKAVPAGVAPTAVNSAYWQKVSDRGAQGPQGQSYVDKELVPIVNDLTTGGSANVLSAEQGKVLDGKLTELSEETKKISEDIYTESRKERVVQGSGWDRIDIEPIQLGETIESVYLNGELFNGRVYFFNAAGQTNVSSFPYVSDAVYNQVTLGQTGEIKIVSLSLNKDSIESRLMVLDAEKVGKKSINLFDKSQEGIVGAYVGSDLTLSKANNCVASHLIPIKPNTLYSWNAKSYDSNNIRFVAEDGVTGLSPLNEQGEAVNPNVANYGLILSPSNAAYFQFTIDFLGRVNIAESACLIESDIFIEQYVPYGLYADVDEFPPQFRDLPQRVNALEHGSENPLLGKSIYFCGDSIMNGLLVDADRRLYNQIADKYGMVANNKSLDGSVFFYPMNNNRESIYWQLTQIPSDADYIIIQGGVNGINMTNPNSTPYFPMGEMTDSYKSEFDLSTQLGCVEAICKYLYDNFSGKKFGFIITYQIESTYEAYLKYWKPKADSIVKVLEKWGIPYIDWRQSGVNLTANSQKYGFSVFDYEEFSESKNYNLDDKVRYNNIGYKAKVAIAAGKPFDASQWQQLSTKAEEHDTWHCNALAYDLLSYQTGKWIETL